MIVNTLTKFGGQIHDVERWFRHLKLSGYSGLVSHVEVWAADGRLCGRVVVLMNGKSRARKISYIILASHRFDVKCEHTMGQSDTTEEKLALCSFAYSYEEKRSRSDRRKLPSFSSFIHSRDLMWDLQYTATIEIIYKRS